MTDRKSFQSCYIARTAAISSSWIEQLLNNSTYASRLQWVGKISSVEHICDSEVGGVLLDVIISSLVMVYDVD